MTKVERILTLHAEGKSTREIAEEVMGLSRCAGGDDPGYQSKMAYVRVVARQRNSPSYGSSPADFKYRQSEKGRETSRVYKRHRWWSDPDYRHKEMQRKRDYRARIKAEARP